MKRSFAIVILLICCKIAAAQEVLAPIGYNPRLAQSQGTTAAKTTVLSLPFFDDFSNSGPIPDQSKWTDRSVYINNTMAVDPVSRGVATFDALDYRGAPYDSTNPYALLYADSLTSQPIDLSNHQPGDSIYLSFFYQPQGRGFSPEVQDSLILYFKKSTGAWSVIWSKSDTVLQPFRQVMVGVNDTSYLHNDFQFRFVNKATININDDVWNVDYVRLAANRSFNDTAVNDVSTKDQPDNMLNDYTSMPYRQFKANMSGELAAQHSFSVRNFSSFQRNVLVGYTAREQSTGASQFNSPVTNESLAGYEMKQYSFPVYSPVFNAPTQNDRVVFENKFFVSDPSGSDFKGNDTIVHHQIFDNYLAYDDGTAEKSYFLKQGNTLPAKIAIEFHLNQPDTLRGLAIYFGRQVPLALSKFFDIAVYKHITVGSYFDTAIYQHSLLFPGYVDTVNQFWVYRFDNPVPMPAGTFYVGTVQPAQSGSDSLYFGFDVNRKGGNHLYINNNGTWQPSIVQGALMIRPLLGQQIIGTFIKDDTRVENSNWSVFPNPAKNSISIRRKNGSIEQFELMDMQGRVLIRGNEENAKQLDLSQLAAGIYFVRISENGQMTVPKKIIKL